MFSKTIILALFASSATFAASIQQRQLNPSVQLCSNKNFNDCLNGAGRLNDKVSSLKANGHNCIFYK
ncbi:hypothetical protein J4E90_007515 [Alternaria incomplexa]|uniref:uncharacterized protein n=1 Tax=Alternaria incomplexa TaxID=1187928 RepID=UPI0022208314|nr:uncharacterized protein J4E90_007515 [Alternaria incomplexa]KAI4910085.1 hypothetical protein J4E90_007515 [Alternaria incomplexa]